MGNSSWWVNNIGIASTATTPSGGIPQYGLAYSIGTADGWDSDTFQTFVEDQTQRQNSEQVKQLELQAYRETLIAKYGGSNQGSWPEQFGMTAADVEDKSTFQAGLSAVGHIAGSIFGETHRQVDSLTGSDLWEQNRESLELQGIDQATWDKFSATGQNRLIGELRAGQITQYPGIKQGLQAMGAAYEGVTNTLETAPLMFRNTIRGNKMFWEPGAFGEAWRAAEDRSPAESLIDSTALVFKSDSDLDRIRRTNNLYQMTAFGGDLAVAFVADPGVIAAKGLGTARSIARNELPHVGSKGADAALSVLRAEDPSAVEASGGIRSRVGYYRGQRMVRTFPELRQAAQDMDIADFQNLPMFRRRAISGGDLAYAFKYAAGDDKLWDLTRRASFGDAAAWHEIRAMKDGEQEILGKYQGSDPQNYLDALDVAKTNEKTLQTEIEDLQKVRQGAQKLQGNVDPEMFRIYSWDLDRSIESKQFDVQDLHSRLEKYEDYQTWLETQKQFSFVDKETGEIKEALYYGGSATSVSLKPERLSYLSRRTYKTNPYGVAHTAHGISRAGWVREANPIDLHRVSSGTESLMRQFEQLQVHLNYADREAVNSSLTEFGHARDEFERFQVARKIEDEHLPRALASYFGLEDDTVRMFMEKIRERKDTMVNALVAGEGNVFSTAGATVERGVDHVKIIDRQDGYVRLQFADGNKLTEMTVPEHALETQTMPVDPTQTPNYYQPLNARDLKLAIRRDHDLFTELETASKNRGRQAAALIMNGIDEMGGRWNKFWKPLQLFRLGWPQRVLMDESLRGLVILGMGPAIRAYGPAYAKAGVNAISQHVIPGVMRADRRAFLKAGPGPVTDKLSGRDYDVPLLDEIQDAAPVVPERFIPKVNATRATAVDKLIHDATELEGYHADRIRAFEDRGLIPHVRPALTLERESWDELHELLPDLAIEAPWVPVVDEIKASYARQADTGPRLIRTVFDPITGQKLKNGYAVPMMTSSTTISGAKTFLSNFVRENRDLIASGGVRVVAEGQPGGMVSFSLARVFKNAESKTAVEFLQHVKGDKLYNVRKGAQEEWVREWDDKSPITEYVDRPTFVGTPEKEFQEGSSPAEGVPPVYHGTYGELPPDLGPRENAPRSTGRMVGDGFYTTVDREMATNYAGNDPTQVYTIRGSKSNKQYEVFNLDHPMLPDDKDEFLDFVTDYYTQQSGGPYQLDAYTDPWIADVRQSSTWLDVMRDLEHALTGDGLSPQQLFTRFLEMRRGAGALTHVGGLMMGNRTHQVYVWLHPEDLMVRPAYAPNGKFHLLEDWLSNTGAQERIVDENRIHRVGKRDKQLRHLEHVHTRRLELERQAEANNTWDELYSGNDEWDQLLKVEFKLMESNGLVFTHNVRDGAPDGAHWYTAKYPKSGPAFRDAKAQANVGSGVDRIGAAERSGAVQESEFGMGDLDFSSWDSSHDSFLRNLLRKREYGKGTISMKGPDGQKVVYDKPFEGAGEVYQSLLSSSPAYAKLTDRYKRTLSAYRQKAVGYKRIQPPKVDDATLRTRGGYQKAREYYVGWADVLNHQIRNSPIWYKMLEGKSNDEIVDWLVNSAEGAKIRASLPHKGQHPEDWVEEHRFELDTYLPNKAMQAQLAKARVNPTELRKIADEDRPDVAAEDLELINGTGIGAMFGRTVEKIYHALGTIPTDILNRQPFFSGMYDLKMKNLIGSHHEGPLDNAVLKGYEKMSREFALAQVRRTMFDLSDDTNMSQALRFVAPFWGAQSEALEKWFRMFVDKPETVARFYAGMNVAYDRLTVVNEDGEKVSSPDSRFGYNPNDRIVLQIPENLKKIAPFDKMLEQFGSVDFSLGSLNTSIQGENPLLPSLGPLVVVPANAAVNAMWDTHATDFDENFFYRWLFPVGRASGNPLDQLIDQTAPGWAKRTYAQLTGTESRMYNSVYWSVYREMEYNNKLKGLPSPTPNEVSDAVRWHMGLRVVGSFGLPVQLNFRPKNQFFLDEYHRLIREVGPGPAFEEFVKKYGVDAAYFAASSSTSVGVPSTSEGMSEWSKSKDLIQANPEWADAIISPDAWADDFSSDAYDQQFDISLGPGTTDKLREVISPEERQRVTDVRTGWLQFRQFSSAIDAELAARGLTSLEQSAAADLKAMKRGLVIDLMGKNESWSEDYDTLSNTINQRVDELKVLATKPLFDNRPEWQGVRQYLVVRDQAVGILNNLGATGGSRNLQAADNTQIRDWFYNQVGSLVLANPAFGEFYSRWLSTDRLEGRASQQ